MSGGDHPKTSTDGGNGPAGIEEEPGAGPYHFVRFTAGGTRWMMREDWRRKLPQDFFTILGTGEQVPGCKVVKTGKMRTVLKMAPPGDGEKGVFIKCHVRYGRVRTAKNLIFPSKAHTEWRMSRTLIDEGFPTSAALGFGEERRFGFLKKSFYITESIDEGIDLFTWWGSDHNSKPADRRSMIYLTARLLRDLHDRNYFPTDFHPGNLIVSRGEKGDHRLHMIDLHDVKKVGRLKMSHRKTNLVQINSAAHHLSVGARLRFLGLYAGMGSALHLKLLSERGQVQKSTDRFRMRQHKKHTKRCLKGKYIFGKWRRHGITVFHRLDFDYGTALRAVSDYRAAPRVEGIRFIKGDHERTILTLPLGDGHGEAMERACIKHFRPRGLLFSLKDLFRISKGRRSWTAGNALMFREVPACIPLALVEGKRGGLLKESFLIMEDLSAQVALFDYVLRDFRIGDAGTTARKRRLAAALARHIGRLHEIGIYHSDLKSQNILVEEADGWWRFHYIDLDGAKIGRKVSRGHRAKNLAQLETSIPDCITFADRMRFLVHYLSEAKEITDRKAFLSMVAARAGRRVRSG